MVTGSVQESSERTEHEVRLTGLAPSTTYFYAVGTSATTLSEYKLSPGLRPP